MQLTKGKVRLTSLALILCVFALVLAACGSTPGTTNNPAKQQMATADKQVFRQVLEGGDFDTVDPALTNGSGDPINILYTGLVGQDIKGEVIDQMAASHSVSQDGKTYTFILKDGLKFSDGSQVTADDIAYSINRVIMPDTKSSVAGYLSLLKDFDAANTGKIKTLIGDSIIAQDQKTVVLKLSKSAAYFFQILEYPTSFVVNKKIIEKYGEKWTDHLNEPGASTGPFKVESYSHTTGMVLVPNPQYYGPKPKLSKITYTIGGDRDANYKSYKAGQYDIAGVPPSQDDLAAKLPGYHINPSLAIRYIQMNYLSKPFDNVKIRQAFALALNRKLVIERIIGKNVTPTNHIVPKGQPGYNENLTGPAGIASLTGDQAKAKELFQQGLQDAGYGTVDKLPAITLTYIQSYKAGADTMTAFAAQWKEVLGVDIKVTGIPANDFYKAQAATVGNGSFQMFYGIWGADYPDPQDWLSVFFGKGSDHNAANYGVTADQKAVQDSLALADTEQDTAKRMKMYNDAEEKIMNEAGWLPTYQSVIVQMVNPKLQNYKLNAIGNIPTDDWQNIYFVQ